MDDLRQIGQLHLRPQPDAPAVRVHFVGDHLDEGRFAGAVVTDEGNGVLEIKNIATLPDYQKQGYAQKLIDFLVAKYSEQYSVLQVGTGDSPLTIPFYEKCGFIRSYVVKDFFIDNYDHPIFECGKQLIDMVYLQKTL